MLEVGIVQGATAVDAHVETSDQELVRRSLDGKPDSFDSLVLRYQEKIYNTIYRMVGDPADAGDLTQEVFIRAYRSLGSFRGDAQFSTWLYRIALNQATSARRSAARRARHPVLSLDVRSADGDAIVDPGDRTSEPTNLLEESERTRLIQQAIDDLDPDHRCLIVLRDVEGLSYEEMAQATGLPIGTVRSRLHRGRQELRRKLESRI